MSEFNTLLEQAKEALANASPCPDPDIENYRGGCDVTLLSVAFGQLLQELDKYTYCDKCKAFVRK